MFTGVKLTCYSNVTISLKPTTARFVYKGSSNINDKQFWLKKMKHCGYVGNEEKYPLRYNRGQYIYVVSLYSQWSNDQIHEEESPPQNGAFDSWWVDVDICMYIMFIIIAFVPF